MNALHNTGVAYLLNILLITLTLIVLPRVFATDTSTDAVINPEMGVASVATIDTIAAPAEPSDLSPAPQLPTPPEPIAPDTTPKSAPETLTPAMRAALDHITRRYRVPYATLLPIFQVAQTAGQAYQLDPLLIVAVIGIESSFNPSSESSAGALGLMQVMPNFHQDKIPDGAGKDYLLDPTNNIRVGVRILEESIQRCGNLIAGLQQYSGASYDDQLNYAYKVLTEKWRLEREMDKSRPALASIESLSTPF